MKRIIGIVLCVLTIAGYAQDTTRYPFINYGSSKLIFSKDSSNMLGFYKKLDDLKKGDRKKVSIVHIGGSHIQAGFWSESLHDQFQALGNYEGGGMFAFPFKLGKTNGPHSYRTYSNGTWKRCRCIQKEKCTPLGVSGIAVVTNDSANYFAIKIQPNKHLKNFSKIKIYHNFNPSFLFSVRREVPIPYKRFDNQKEGYTQYIFDNPIDSVCFDMIRKDTLNKDFALFGFSLDNDNPGIYYASMGVNGASTESFLRCENFVTQLKTLQPDLVIFSLGVNDVHGPNFRASDYMTHYDTLVTYVKQAAPDCAILFTTISDNYIRRKTPNKKTMLGDDAILELAEKRNLAVWDLFTVMGGYKSIYKWQKAKLAGKDKVHFNGRGYNLISSLMFDAIMKSYKYNSTLSQ